MKLDVRLTVPQQQAGEAARRYEEAGYSGIWISETTHDPFLSVLLSAQTTTTAEVGTSIVVAFARSPMTVAISANDLQALSGGRLVLGLGTQVRSHILHRFSMPWSHPALRMREFVLALRTIWGSWNEGVPLDFEGEFYHHTLMTPFFAPDPNPFGPPKVMLAGVGPRMTEVAGEVADGFICHAFTTERYLREVTIPALARGRAGIGKCLEGFEISGPSFIVTGATAEEFDVALRETKRQIAFYASTPAYRPVLEVHGWGELQSDLNALARQDRWDEMGELIDDDILNSFAIVAEPNEIAPALAERFEGLVQRTSLYIPYESDPSTWQPVVDAIRWGG
jgi:probable F420-dependent oxidoreductase